MKIGGLEDCHCETSGGDLRVPVVQSTPKVKKPRKPRSKGAGTHCVVSHKGKTVFCYESAATAKRVAEAFTKKGRAGTSFKVESRTKG